MSSDHNSTTSSISARKKGRNKGRKDRSLHFLTYLKSAVVWCYITPAMKKWTARVLVESKTIPRSEGEAKKSFQRFTLVDEEGTKITAVAFGNAVPQFDRILNVMGTYQISSARVKETKIEYRTHGNLYHWVLEPSTMVHNDKENQLPDSLAVKTYTSFNALVPFKENSRVDILAIVIKKFGPRTINISGVTVNIHEFGVINHEEKPLIITLWRNVAISEGAHIMSTADPMPVIAASNLNVSEFYGLSLASTWNTTVIIDPPIPEAQKLKTWRATHQRIITRSLSQFDAMIRTQRTSPMTISKLYTIAEMLRTETEEKFTLKAKMKITNMQQHFYYISCNKCLKSQKGSENWKYDFCPSCKDPGFCVARELVIVNIVDHTGDIDVAAFGELAARLTLIDAKESMKIYEAGDVPDIDSMNAAIGNSIYLLKLKRSSKTKADGVHIQYAISNMTKETLDSIAISTPPQATEKLHVGNLLRASSSTPTTTPNEPKGKAHVVKRLFVEGHSQEEEIFELTNTKKAREDACSSPSSKMDESRS